MGGKVQSSSTFPTEQIRTRIWVPSFSVFFQLTYLSLTVMTTFVIIINITVIGVVVAAAAVVVLLLLL